MPGKRKLWAIAGGALLLAAIGGGAGIAIATGVMDDDEQPITGPALERASAAALAHTGGGTVTETEVGDEEGYYEVEVTLDDGSQVDVHLDEDFSVIGSDMEGSGDDDDGAGDDDGPNDD